MREVLVVLFTNNYPKTWKELQDRVAELLCQSGYKAISPYKIDTVRGTVEIDVFVESPDTLIKTIICECKYWKTRVSQEKVHAFQTVVSNTGASLGILISQCGFQSGAIEAAKFSNIKLVTWEEFTNLIREKWLTNRLIKIKKDIIPLREYMNDLHFPFEKLGEYDKKMYLNLCNKYNDLKITCCVISKEDFIKEDIISTSFYHSDEFDSIVEYLDFLEKETFFAVKEFEKIIDSSNIVIPQSRFDKKDIYTFMF